MRDLTPTARRRMTALKQDARNWFESPILHNRVSVTVHEDDRLRHVVDVTEQAYSLEEHSDLPDDVRRTAFGAAEDLNDEIDALVENAVLGELVSVLDDARDGWFDDLSDHHDAVDVRDAFDEASLWIAEHDAVAERNEIDVDDVCGTSDELDLEVTADV